MIAAGRRVKELIVPPSRSVGLCLAQMPGLELGLSANIGFFRYAQICPAGHGLLGSE